MFTSLIIFGFTLDDVFAGKKEITSRFFSYENTSIIEFTNKGTIDINSFRIWLARDFDFKSFKTEQEWVGEKTPQGVIIFTSSESIKPGESVKFGVKTDKVTPGINWKALDTDGNLMATGKTLSQTMLSFVSTQKHSSITELSGILSESVFKIVPTKLHPGSTIRVAGNNFVPNSSLELFLNDEKLKSFETNEDGHFMLTIKIPKKTSAGHVSFSLKDKQENEKTINLLLTKIQQTIPKNIDFTVSETPNEFFRMDRVEFSGTANPETQIIIKIKNPLGEVFSTKTKNTDSQGNWHISFYLSTDATIGKYFAEITDGEKTIIESWDVALSKKIHIVPTKTKFELGEPIKFNGTASPNERLEIKFVNPQGNEVISKKLVANDSGFIEITYPTVSSTLEGTYTLYAFQENESEIVFVGLGKNPKETLSAKLNSVNYRGEEIAIIGMTGKPSQDLTLLILDQNGYEKFNDKIKLGLDGKRNYELNLTTFPTGVYTLLVSMLDFQISETFTTGLQSSSIPIDLDMIKTNYNPGESLNLIGQSQPNTTVNLLLIDPDGILVNEKESFINKNGNLSINDFKIPYDAAFGKWIIRAESNTNYANLEFQVTSLDEDMINLHVTDILSSTVGKFVTIEGSVNSEQTVKITIEDPQGNVVFQTNVRTTESGEFDLLWKVESDYVSGTYSVIVEDSSEKTARIVFDL